LLVSHRVSSWLLELIFDHLLLYVAWQQQVSQERYCDWHRGTAVSSSELDGCAG
jgi:hypothetical protein